MALTSTTLRALYTGNGSTTSFAIPGTIINDDSTEVVVYTRNEATTPATETLQVEGALQNYTLTGASPPTTPFNNTVEFNTAPASGIKVLVIRQLARTQTVDVNSNSEVISATTMEEALDRATALSQQMQEQIDRAPKFQITSSTTGIEMPEPSSLLLLQWNTAADGIENGVSSATIAGYAAAALASEAAAAVSESNASSSASAASSSASAASISASAASVSADAAAASAALAGSPADANKVLAGPVSGAAATAAFRALVSADIPNNAADTTGNAATATLAAAVTTNANLTGPITSTGNATALAAQTGTGSVFVVQNSPTLTTPDIGASTGTSLQLSGLTASRALQTDASKNLESSAVTTTELGYVSGVTSAIQTQLGTKITNPMTTGGDIIYGGASGTPTRLANGSSGQVLTSAGSTSAPTWEDPGAGSYTAPLITKYTSGSGTHTFTGSPLYVRVRMVGGGGGGGGSATTADNGGNGGDGGASTFGTTLLSASGGIKGIPSGKAGGVGGAASLGTGPTGIANQGGAGSPGQYIGAGSSYAMGGNGGVTPFGGAGGGGGGGTTAVVAVIANTGSGGGGGGSPAIGVSGSGGGAGGFVDAIISGSTLSGMSGSASYAVGAAGTAGAAGTSGAAGGVGSAGFIEVTEYYQ